MPASPRLDQNPADEAHNKVFVTQKVKDEVNYQLGDEISKIEEIASSRNNVFEQAVP